MKTQDKESTHKATAPFSTLTSRVPVPSSATGFSRHLSTGDAKVLLQKAPNRFIRGCLHINPGYLQGTVYSERHRQDVHISTREALNRALDGDEVVVYLLESEEQKISYVNWSLDDVERDEILTITKSRMEGLVVAILKPANPEVTLECTVQKDGHVARVVRLMPKLRNFPLIEVPGITFAQKDSTLSYIVRIDGWYVQNAFPHGTIVSECPCKTQLTSTDDITQDPQGFLDAKVEHILGATGFPYHFRDDHDASPYQKVVDEGEQELMDLCGLTREQIYQPSDLSSGTYNSLMEYFTSSEFEDKLRALGRRNFCMLPVFTIDPDTARDFDDAIHVSVLIQDGEDLKAISMHTYLQMKETDEVAPEIKGYEVGIHIADTTHYLDKCPWLDARAQETTTSIYLSDRCCPMLPKALSNTLCSLNPLVPRFTFSLVVQLSSEGLILPQDIWFGRGLIFSYARLDYCAAQRLLEANYTNDDVSPKTTLFFDMWPCIEGFAPTIAAAVQHANQMAHNFRAIRKSYGALTISLQKVRLSIDVETLTTEFREPERADDAHNLIEEFMLLANQLVASKLVACFPTLPILRVHPPPIYRSEVDALFASHHFPRLCIESSQQINKYICALAEVMPCSNDKKLTAANTIFLHNLLARASYHIGTASCPQILAHWGIHSSLYMHFTSPIRRYADDIAHRMLALGLALEARIFDKNPTYDSTPEFALRPYRLRIPEPWNIYEKPIFFPPTSLTKLVDSIYRGEDEGMIEEGNKTRSKKGLSQFLRDNEQLATLARGKIKEALRAIVDMVNQCEDITDGVIPAVEAPSSKDDPVAMSVVKDVEKDLEELGYKYETLKSCVELCNKFSKEADRAEEVDQRILFALRIEKTPEYRERGGIPVTAYVTKLDQKFGIIFSVFEYGLYFALKRSLIFDEHGKARIEDFAPDVPVERQQNERQANSGPQAELELEDFDVAVELAPEKDSPSGARSIELVVHMMQHFDALLVPCSESILDGIDLLLTNVQEKK
ncbi:putative Ribonuclease [Giardia muris]|uniref:Putative Ribonuclease n=1 Tax=Giardia muris TaxID=5742 RepID=A0A4Z1SW60_GIAMU|nr:putative Ribonuclease [Giardia muris]|eukprot:TNJ30014.1 putative Ribonuclease [Giardia muris]